MGGAAPPLVRREAEQALLDLALQRAADGPQLVLLLGEAGMGKTRLLESLVATAGDTGWRVLTGACVHLSAVGLPWAPWVQLLRRLERVDPAAAEAPALRRLLTGAAGTTASPAALLDRLLDLVEQLAAQGPLLLAVEDLHWADPASVDALAFLVRNLAALPVLLAATSRTDTETVPEVRTVLAELRRDPRATAVELGPLDPDGVAALAASLSADPAAAGELHRRTGGNPYWTVEVVLGGGALPDHLADVVLTRLDGLPADARLLLDAMALVDRPVPGACSGGSPPSTTSGGERGCVRSPPDGWSRPRTRAGALPMPSPPTPSARRCCPTSAPTCTAGTPTRSTPNRSSSTPTP